MGLLIVVPGRSALGDGAYRLGQGYALPWLGLKAGGYLTVRGADLEGQDGEVTLQNLSLFLSSDITPRWHFFAEVEVGNSVTVSDDGWSTSGREFDVERLYLERDLSARTTLRLGKFLTPIGRWNLIHADPLVWSVSRPLTTSAPFSRHAAGLELTGSRPLAAGLVDYRLWVDDTAVLDPSQGREEVFVEVGVPGNPRNAFDHGFGARVRYWSLDEALQVGVSVAHFRIKDQSGQRNLVGADLFYTRGGAELTGEAVYRGNDSPAVDAEWGGFLQLAVPLRHGFYGVATHERYKAEAFPDAVTWDSLGVTYRPTPPVSLKLERRETRGEEPLAPDGWQFSIGVLF